MSLDALPPTSSASRSLTSFIQQLDNYDPEDYLYEGEDQAQGIAPENVLKFLRCLRGFVISARARIIEAQLPTVRDTLAILAAPIQQLNDQIFLLERGGMRTAEEIRGFLTETVKNLREGRDQIAALATTLSTSD